jgi:hypothetical protein
VDRGKRHGFEAEVLSSIVDASIGTNVRPFVEGLFAIRNTKEESPLLSLSNGNGIDVLNSFEASCSPNFANVQKMTVSTNVPGLSRHLKPTYLTDLERVSYLSTAARVTVLEMIFSAFDHRGSKNCHFDRGNKVFWSLDFDSSGFKRINMSDIKVSTLRCAELMWKVGSPFPTCQFLSYMAKSLSDIHYSILSNELYMRMRRYNVFAQHLQPQFSNNVSQCIELFNIAMPPTNKVQKPIPFQHVQVQPQKEHNVSCRVDVQKIWADFLSHRVHILKKVLGNFSSTCPP